MKKILFRIVVSLFVVVFLAGFLKDRFIDSPGAIANKTRLLTQDKVLVYDIYLWSIVPMGKLHLSKEASVDALITYLEATTEDTWMNNIIQASARVESHINPVTGLPTKFIEKTSVKGAIKEKTIFFDQQRLIATRGDTKMKIPQGTYDPISAFTYCLQLPYTLNQTQIIKFLSKRDIYLLKSTLLNEANGLYELGIDMKRENLTSSHGANFHVWVTADDMRLPVLFKSLTPVGYVSVVLNRVENEAKL